MLYDYDVAYLGSGHSCWHGALTLAAAGKKVVLMDHDLPGGACTNKKSLKPFNSRSLGRKSKSPSPSGEGLFYCYLDYQANFWPMENTMEVW